LATEGPILTVYDLQSRKIIFSKALFASCFKITEVRVLNHTGNIILHTEKSLKVLNGDNYEVLFEFMKESVDKIIHSDVRLNESGEV